MPKKGMLLVISGPSGVGKDTVFSVLQKRLGKTGIKLWRSVSVTTREPREGEIDGVHYSFVTREDFGKLIDDGMLLEYAEYAGNFYGTPAAPIDEHLSVGDTVVLAIETKGAMNVRQARPDAVLVFMMPPSLADLRKRLNSRGSENEEQIEKRMEICQRECDESSEYDYIVVNREVEKTAEEIEKVILKNLKNRKKHNI